MFLVKNGLIQVQRLVRFSVLKTGDLEIIIKQSDFKELNLSEE